MKRVIVMEILTAMLITILGACGDTEGTKQSQEAQDMSSNSFKTESEEIDVENG